MAPQIPTNYCNVFTITFLAVHYWVMSLLLESYLSHIIGGCSIDYPDAPKHPKAVRAENGPTGFTMRPLPGGKTEFRWDIFISVGYGRIVCFAIKFRAPKQYFTFKTYDSATRGVFWSKCPKITDNLTTTRVFWSKWVIAGSRITLNFLQLWFF